MSPLSLHIYFKKSEAANKMGHGGFQSCQLVDLACYAVHIFRLFANDPLRPSSTMALAPPPPSSAGWKARTTVPLKLRVSVKYFAIRT